MKQKQAKLILVALLVFFGLGTAVSYAEKSTAAVMPFAKGAGGAEFDGLGRALADMMVTDLAQADSLQLVERTQLKHILDELKLGKSGYLDKRTAQKLGRGLGAQYIITGSFTVSGGTFSMDCRIFSVANGAIIKAVQSSGPVADFVAVQKDVTEKFLSGLKVKLSLAARRKLLVQTPTENALALASYGRGLDAVEAGNLVVAQQAFAKAIASDPNFSVASEKLASLATAVKVVVDEEDQRERRSRGAPLLAALKQLRSEMTRKSRFRDTRDSLIDFTIRQRLLRNTEQHCQRYRELKHYLFRKKGKLGGVFSFVPAKSTAYLTNYDVEEFVEERMKQLGVAQGDTLFKDKGDHYYVRAATRETAYLDALLWGDSFRLREPDGLLLSLHLCFAPALRVSEMQSLLKKTKGWKAFDLPMKKHKMSIRDGLELQYLFVQAENLGVRANSQRRLQALIARYPSGHPDRKIALKASERIVAAGRGFVASRRTRGNLSEKEIVRIATAVVQENKGAFHATPRCQAFVKTAKQYTLHGLKRYQESFGKVILGWQGDSYNKMASGIMPLLMSGCVRSSKRSPLTAAQITNFIKRAAVKVNPAPDVEPSCSQVIKSVTIQLQLGTEPYSQFQQLHFLQTSYQLGCLLR